MPKSRQNVKELAQNDRGRTQNISNSQVFGKYGVPDFKNNHRRKATKSYGQPTAFGQVINKGVN